MKAIIEVMSGQTGVSSGSGSASVTATTLADTLVNVPQRAANLGDLTDKPTALTNIGALAAAKNLSDLSSLVTALANLGLVIGTNVQAYDPLLTSNIRRNIQNSAWTTILSDAEKFILHQASDATPRIWTIDSNANVPYVVGTVLSFVNEPGAGGITLSITADTLYFAGLGTTGSRTLAANGFASALKFDTTKWIINGAGLT
jgi:hypothetical protein